MAQYGPESAASREPTHEPAAPQIPAQRRARDLGSLVIWGLLASRNVAHLLPPGILPAEVLDDGGQPREKPMQLRPLRIRDIAQATRIPRETVRRKLEKLQRAGRVVRTRAGWTYNPESVDGPLREFTKETIRRHLATTQVVVNTLAAAR